MVWALTLIACAIVFSPRIIAYLIPGWVGLSVIGLLIFWPHMPEWTHSAVMWGVGALLAAFLIAIPLRLVLGIPIAAGIIGCIVLAVCYYAVTTVDKLWQDSMSAVGEIPTYHWVIAACALSSVILVECCKTWKRTHPPLADDDDEFDDDPTDTRLVLRLAPPRPPSRKERKRAERAAAEAANAAAWRAWGKGNGPRPPL